MNTSLYSLEECDKIAQNASLRYTQSSQLTVTRKKHGKGYAYYTKNGKKISDLIDLKRFKSLAIPPGYTNVQICAFANGHLQAKGQDGKKCWQYIYHPL